MPRDQSEAQLFSGFHIRNVLDEVPIPVPEAYAVARALIEAQEQSGQEVETIAQEALKLVGEFRSQR